MGDYINRKALNEKCYAIYEEIMRQGKGLTIEEVDRLLCRFETEIKEAPAEDVAPVVHGRWISATERYPNKRGWYIVCDKSGGVKPDIYEVLDDGRAWFKSDFSLLNIGLEPYITHWMPLPEPPNCGARMDGE